MIKDRDLKPGTTLVAHYKDKEYRAKVMAGKDGKLRYRLADGREFKGPSGAGSAVMGGVACNGWRAWSVAGSGRKTTVPARAPAKATGRAKSKRPATRRVSWLACWSASRSR